MKDCALPLDFRERQTRARPGDSSYLKRASGGRYVRARDSERWEDSPRSPESCIPILENAKTSRATVGRRTASECCTNSTALRRKGAHRLMAAFDNAIDSEDSTREQPDDSSAAVFPPRLYCEAAAPGFTQRVERRVWQEASRIEHWGRGDTEKSGCVRRCACSWVPNP